MTNKFKRIASLILSAVILISVFIPTATTAFAANSGNSVGADADTGITIITQEYAYKYYSGWNVWGCKFSTEDGQTAFCLQPKVAAPKETKISEGTYKSTYGSDKISAITNENVLKAFYYGYGPGQTVANDIVKSYSGNVYSTVKEYMDSKKSSLNFYIDVNLRSEWDSDEAYYYAFTHLLAAYLDDTSALPSTMSLYPAWRTAVIDLADKVIKKLPSVSGKLKAYEVDTGNSTQKMAYVEYGIKLKIEKVSANPSFTNNNSAFSLKGARYVVFTNKTNAEAASRQLEDSLERRRNSLDDYIEIDENGIGWFSESDPKATVDADKTYYALEWRSPKGYALSNTVYQFKETEEFDTDGVPIYAFSAIEKPKISLSMKKVSSNPSISENNSCYSLKGAVYTIYTDAAATKPFKGGAKIITDENGNGSYRSGELIDAQQLWAKETTAPKGFALDETVYKFTDSGKTDSNGYPVYSFSCSDDPDGDPVSVLLKKYNAITGETSDNLGDAHFEIKYYDNIYNSVDEIGTVSPKRSWILKTYDDGYLQFEQRYKVSGDEFYYDEGTPVIPIGTITVQEIKAPTGYQINPEIFLANITQEGEFIRWRTTNEPILPVPEAPDNGGVTIQKTSGDNIVANIWFNVRSLDDGNDFDRDFKTNKNGLITDSELSGLTVGKYRVTELGFKRTDGTYYYPKRYGTNGVFGTKPRARTVTVESNKTVTVMFENKLIPGELDVYKQADDGDVEGVYFSVSASTGAKYPNIVTDSAGKAKLTNLPIFDDNDEPIIYTVNELGKPNGNGTFKIPERYIKAEAQQATLENGIPIADGNRVSSVTFHNRFVPGRLFIKKTVTDSEYPITGLWFRVTSDKGFSQDVELTELDSITEEANTAHIDNLDVFDENGEPIVYTIAELGFKNGGSYSFPKYYYRTAPLSVTLSDAGVKSDRYVQTANVVNRVKEVKLNLKKTSSDKVVKDIWFLLTSSADHAERQSTNTNGLIKFGSLPIYDNAENPIEYTIEELGEKNADETFSLPKRYQRLAPIVFTLEEYDTDESFERDVLLSGSIIQTTTKKVTNKLIYGNLSVTKKATDNKVDNIYFQVTDSKGADYGIQATNADGYARFLSLPVYDTNNEKLEYTVTELGELQPDGSYKIPERYTPRAVVIKTTLNADENAASADFTPQTTVVEFLNIIYGSVTLQKLDGYGNELKGSEWTLYDSKNNAVTMIKNADESYSVSGNGNLTAAATNDNGKLVIDKLLAGTYHFRETKTPDNKMVYGKFIYFTISGDSPEKQNVSITVKNNSVILYDTGGNGIKRFILTGSAVLLLSAIGAAVIFLAKRKDRKTKK